MIDSELDRLLVQVRRIEEHREKGAEAEIRKNYQKLLQELRHYMADEYSRYAEDDKLTYDILQKNGYYARFLEEVEQKIDDISPEVRRTIRSTVEQTYEHTYNGMIDCLQKTATGVDLGVLKGCTPEVIKRAVENPISKLTLNDRLEKHRKEIIYDIKQDISVGLMNGDRYSTMANRIKKSVEGDYKKAIRIARTETHRVREAGNHDAAVSVNDALKNSTAGVQMMKTWRTMKDERVRPAKAKGRKRKYDHRKMEGISIPIDEEFTLPSGAKTTAPGQSGVAGEDINCRCYLSYGLQSVSESDKMKVTKETESESIETVEETTYDIEGNTTKLKGAMSENDYAEYVNRLNNHPNPSIKKLYASYGDEIRDVKKTKYGAYTPSTNSLTFSYPAEHYIANGKDKYSTIAHEYGHFFDAKCSYDVHFAEIDTIKDHIPYSKSWFKRNASSSDEFLAAIRKDKQLLKVSLTAELKEDLRAHDASDGVQDAIDGLLGQRINWGHGDKYYNRVYSGLKKFNEQKSLKEAYKELGFDVSNQEKVSRLCRDYESASEMWANIMAAETNGGQSLEYVKKYLPNSYQAITEIIKGVK